MKVDNCFNLLDSPELLCLSRCLSKKTLLIWIAWTMCTHMATISCDLGKDHKEQMPSNAGSNRACRTHSISDKAFDFAISSREAPILPMPDRAASKRAWEFVSYHHSSWSCHIQREVGEMNKAAQGIMQLIEAIGRGRNCPVNFSTALGIKSLY